MFLCHGFGEHLGWYEELANTLVQEGVMVFGHDHQVHQRIVSSLLSEHTLGPRQERGNEGAGGQRGGLRAGPHQVSHGQGEGDQ